MTPSELTCKPRFGTPRNPERPTLGPKVAEVAARLGTPLMPWQHHVADIAFEINPATGGLVYREVVITVPRQSGKTTLGMAVKTHRCTRFGGRQNVTYTAQTRNAARKKWEDDQVRVLEGARRYAGRFEVRRSNGSEAILWRNQSKWAIDAPTKTAGHGETLDLGFIDEAFAHEDDRVEQAMAPAMLTRASPQIWVVSTAGDANSKFLWRKILAGRDACESGEQTPTAYFEWSAPDEADPADPATWRACSPALGHTITEAVLAAEWERARRKGQEGIDLFRRAYLNQWPEVPVLDDLASMLVIPLEDWDGCCDPTSAVNPDASVVFAIDSAPDRTWSSIAVAGLNTDGVVTGEIADRRPGTTWVVHRMRELRDRYQPAAIVLDPAGPARALITDLTAAGIYLTQPNGGEVGEACGFFYDRVTTGQFRHRDDPDLSAALVGARKRPLGDGGWAWSRKDSTVDISPLVALTLATWSAHQHRAEATQGETHLW